MLSRFRTAKGRAWYAAGAPILALVLISMGMAMAMLWSFAREQDNAFATTSSRLVAANWRARETAMAQVALDYAVWNDAYLATTISWDTRWVENNLYSSIADGIYVVRADGRVRHAWTAEAAAAEAELIEQGIVAAVQRQLNLGLLLSTANSDEMTVSTSFIAGAAPVLVSVAPLSPEEETVRQQRDPDLAVDYLVAVDLVTSGELAQTAANLGAAGLRFSAPTQAPDNVHDVSMSVNDASGAAIGALRWARQRPGSAAFLGNAGAIAGFFCLLGALAMLVAQKLVSDQMRAAAEVSSAHEASRIKSEFIGTMSHELRTPLNAIMGYAELIKEEVEDGARPETIVADADRVLAAARHLSRLINDVLDQSRIEAGKLKVSVEPVEVAAVLEELQELIAPLALASGNRLSVAIDEGVRFVAADPMRLQQCLINLAGNALKFTSHGTVDIRARRVFDHANTYVVFEVRDTGIGIAKGELERLFKPFAQAGGQAGAKQGGTGLGLSITRSLARAMGGDVTADSAAGKGSVFRLILREVERPRTPHLVLATVDGALPVSIETADLGAA